MGGDALHGAERGGLRAAAFYIESLPVRIHFIFEMIWWTGLAPWEFEFPFPLAGVGGDALHGAERGGLRAAARHPLAHAPPHLRHLPHQGAPPLLSKETPGSGDGSGRLMRSEVRKRGRGVSKDR